MRIAARRQRELRELMAVLISGEVQWLDEEECDISGLAEVENDDEAAVLPVIYVDEALRPTWMSAENE